MEEKNNEKEEILEEIKYEEDKEKLSRLERKIKKLKNKLKACQKEKEKYLAGWQRERADFINYKKDEEKRLKANEMIQKGKIILKVLSILDNLEKAEKEIPEALKDNEWVKGILKIKKELRDILKREGVEEIKIEEKFNPEFHEVVETVQGDNDKIIEVLQKGYLLNKKVLRFAKVKIAKKSENKKVDKFKDF